MLLNWAYVCLVCTSVIVAVKVLLNSSINIPQSPAVAQCIFWSPLVVQQVAADQMAM